MGGRSVPGGSADHEARDPVAGPRRRRNGKRRATVGSRSWRPGEIMNAVAVTETRLGSDVANIATSATADRRRDGSSTAPRRGARLPPGADVRDVAGAYRSG